MAISKSTYQREVLEEAVGHLLAKRANEQKVPPDMLALMDFKSECLFDASTFQKVLRVRWRDPFDDRDNLQRGFQTGLSEAANNYDRNLHTEIAMAISSLDIRGELFFFKIHKHFPNRVSEVRHRNDGLLTVKFKNGRELTVGEDKIESTEFLATCGMIYDL